MRTAVWIGGAVLGVLAATAPAAVADEPERVDAVFVPGAFAARAGGAWAQVRSGYDTARSELRAEVLAEARVIGPFALRAGVIDEGERVHPLVAVRAQLLRQARQHVDAALVASYEPEGFREAEGRIGVGVQVGRELGRVGALGEAVYGQDPEGDDRQASLQLAVLAGDGAVRVGVAGRLRVDLYSDDVKRTGRGEPDVDSAVGPVATYRWSSMVVSGQVGLAAVELDDEEELRLGVGAELGLGVLF